MANQYRSVLASSGPAPTGGNALPAEVLSGKTFTNDDGAQTGTMVNNGAVTQSLSAGQSYTIPAGYHNGNGVITDVSPALPTSATPISSTHSGSSGSISDLTIGDVYAISFFGANNQVFTLTNGSDVQTLTIDSESTGLFVFKALATSVSFSCTATISGAKAYKLV